MKIKFLGTGSAFTVKNFQTNLAIECDGKHLLLDAGGDIRFSLKDAGLSYKDIDAVYISHLHTDHSGGIEYLAFCTYFDPNQKQKIRLLSNGQLLRDGWEDSWKGGLESIQGKLMSLNDFFDVESIKPNGSFSWQNIQFNIVQTIHIMNGYAIVPSYGLMMQVKTPTLGILAKTIFWTSDSQHCPNQIMDFYKQADLIIQDCETSFKTGVHAHFSELVTLPEETRKKMILVHYQDNILDQDGDVSDEWLEKAKEAGFIGFAKKGYELDLLKPVPENGTIICG